MPIAGECLNSFKHVTNTFFIINKINFESCSVFTLSIVQYAELRDTVK
jgi:hypothetical protein